MKKNLVAGLSLLLGSLIGAITFSRVIMPANLMGGGLGGLALLLNRLTGVDIQILLAILFVPIAVWAFFQYGIRQILSASAGYIAFTIFMGIVPLVIPPLQTDAILAALLSGLLLGVGSGLVLRLGIANGPESLIGMYLKKRFNIPIGTYMMLFNAAVILASLIYSDITLALYSAICIIVSGRVTNIIILGFDRYYEMSIITAQYVELADFIHNTIHRGVTFIQCLGTYELKKQMMVKTLVKNDELVRIKNYLKEADPACFIYINESAEVIGKGFSDYS